MKCIIKKKRQTLQRTRLKNVSPCEILVVDLLLHVKATDIYITLYINGIRFVDIPSEFKFSRQFAVHPYGKRFAFPPYGDTKR